jgi:hypothetical protein
VLSPQKIQVVIKNPEKTGTSSQAITTPQGTGKIQGMGESFSAQLSTGIATYSVPFALPAARGAAQPSLGLSYSSSMGDPRSIRVQRRSGARSDLCSWFEP